MKVEYILMARHISSIPTIRPTFLSNSFHLFPLLYPPSLFSSHYSFLVNYSCLDLALALPHILT